MSADGKPIDGPSGGNDEIFDEFKIAVFMDWCANWVEPIPNVDPAFQLRWWVPEVLIADASEENWTPHADEKLRRIIPKKIK